MTEPLSFRIEPGMSETPQIAAVWEHWSIANMGEVLIQDYCGRNGITISELGRLLPDEKP